MEPTSTERAAPVEATPRPRRRRLLRRLGRAALGTLLLLLVLVMALYLLRQPVLGPWVRDLAASQLGAALDADVHIGAVEGNWITALRARDIDVRGHPGSLFDTIEDGDLAVTIAPLTLIGGDLAGLAAGKLTAAALVLRPGGGAQEPPPEEQPASESDPTALARAFPDGLEVSVTKLTVATPEGSRSAPLHVVLEPGQGERELNGHWGESAVDATVQPGPPLEASAHVSLDDPGGLLRILGVDNRLQGGRAEATLQANLRPMAAEGRLTLSGTHYRGQPLDRSDVRFHIDNDLLQLDVADIDLPGIRTEGRGLSLPSPLAQGGTNDVLSAASGRLRVDIDDLEPYRDLLPAPVRELLPLHGQLDARIAQGELIVDSAQIQSQGIRLHTTAGRLPLRASGGPRAGNGVGFTIDVPQPKTMTLGGGEPAVVQGRVQGTVQGSLEQPSVDLSLDLQQGHAQGLQWDGVGGDLHYGDHRVALSHLRVSGLQPTSGGQPSELGLQGDVALPANDAPLRANVTLTGTIAPSLLSMANVAPALQQRLDPIDVQVHADGTLPAGGMPTGEVDATLSDLRIDGQPPLRVHTRATLTPDHVVELSSLDVSGDVALQAQGTVPLEAGAPIDLTISTDGLNLGRVSAVAGLGFDLEGDLRLQARIGGTLATPTARLDLGIDTVMPAPMRDAWPLDALGKPPLAVALRMQATLGDRLDVGRMTLAVGDANAPTRLTMTAQGGVPVRLRNGALVAGQGTDDLGVHLELQAEGTPQTAPVTIDAALQAAADHTELTLSRAVIGPGSLHARAQIAAPLSSMVLAPDGARDAALTGSFAMDELALQDLPATVVASAQIAGTVTVDGTVAGTLAAPAPTAKLQVQNGSAVMDGTTWVEDLALALTVDGSQARLDTLTARVLGGDLEGKLTVDAAGSPLLGAAPTALALGGSIDLNGVELSAVPMPPSLGEVTGKLALHVDLAGTAAEPEPKAELAIADGNVTAEGAPAVRNLALRVEVDPDAVRLAEAEGQVAGGSLRMNAALQAATADLMNGKLVWSDVPVSGSLNLDRVALNELPADLLGLQDLGGLLTLDASVDGTLATPVPHARLRLFSATLATAGIPRVEDLDAEVLLEPDHLAIQKMTGSMGEGPFELTASVQGKSGESLWQALHEAQPPLAITAALNGRDVLLQRGRGIKIRGHPELKVDGTLQHMTVTGTLAMTNTKIVRRVSLIPDLNARGGAADLDRGIAFDGLQGPLGKAIDLDVAVVTAEPIKLRTKIVDADIETTLRLRGTAASPHLEGNVSSQTGRLSFPGTKLQLDTMLLTFPPERPAFPDLLVRASGKRHGINVMLTVQGTIDNPEVLLTSSPPVPPQELVVLLTTGALPSTLREMGTQGQATLIGSYLAEEIFETYFGSDSTEESGGLADRFHIESGREVSSEGVESLLFEFDLNKHFALQAERDVYEDYNMGVVYRITF